MLQAQIYLDKDELIGLKPLNEFIMELLLEQQIEGATAFIGWFGFGENHKMKKPNQIFSFDETPMLIVFIDEDEKVKAAIQEVRKYYKGGAILTHHVEKW